MSFAERVFWNANAYGSAVRVRRSLLQAALVAACLVTPGTNWMIPFAHRIVRSDLVVRY